MITLDLYKKYVKGTIKRGVVKLTSVLLCVLTNAIIRGIKIEHNKVYISTRVIKHIYDKRPAEEFDFLLLNISDIVKYPDFIYSNKQAKRGNFVFVKELKNYKYFCSIEETQKDGELKCLEIVTFFRINDNNYLKNYELLWKWEGGNLHRNTFDSDKSQSNDTPQ